MLKFTPLKFTPTGDTVKVTFALSCADQPVSVVGEFNAWDPYAHPLKKRSNGTRSATVELPAGSTFRFKYLAADGSWFCDEAAPVIPSDAYGTTDSLLVV